MRSFDYIIVGAGSAGCVLAYRLTVNPNIKVKFHLVAILVFNPLFMVCEN